MKFKTYSKIKVVVVLWGITVSIPSFAALTVSPIFRSNMVLQRGVTVPVFGTGDPGATVTVQFQSQNVSAVVGGDGKWRPRNRA